MRHITAVFVVLLTSVSTWAYAQCPAEDPADMEKTRDALSCKHAEVASRLNDVKAKAKKLLLARIAEYKKSPEALAALEALNNARNRNKLLEKHEPLLLAARQAYISHIGNFIDLQRDIAAVHFDEPDFSSQDSLLKAMELLKYVLAKNTASIQNMKFKEIYALNDANTACRFFEADGGFPCSFQPLDYSIADAFIVANKDLIDLVQAGLNQIRESRVNADTAKLRAEVLALQASAQFLADVSIAKRDFLRGPDTVGGREVYTRYLGVAETMATIPCSSPAKYQVSGCKSTSSEIESAKQFLAKLPNYIAADLPPADARKVEKLGLEEQVKFHEAFFRGQP
jgi:hypothetical protein